MSASRQRRPFDWEAAGEELGETLSSYHMLVVAGADSVITGRVAVGIARAQSMNRRSAVGDLFAESPPIRELVPTDDPHGIVDSFLYGVSISRIAYPVAGTGQLFAMQSGTEPPVYDEILTNPRWYRLCAGFREADALLVLAVPSNAPHLEDLVAAADGAILVANAAPPGIPFHRVIANVREQNGAIGPATRSNPAIQSSAPWWRNRTASIAGVLLTLLIIAAYLWLAYRPFARTPRPTEYPKPDTTQGLGRVIAPDSSGTDTAGAGRVATAMPRPANPGDSTKAAIFGVELMAANTQAGAILKLQKDGKQLPAATFAPVTIQGAPWYKVVSGAFTNRTDADSLLANLRRLKVLDAGRGMVVQAPFAFLIDSNVPAAAVTNLIAAHVNRGEPVYALRQENGTAWLLAGAFESVEQAAGYAESLRASGTAPVLVYRKGRSY